MHLRGYSSVVNVMHGVDPLLACSAKDAQGEALLVYFTAENKVGVRTIRRIQTECEAAACKHVILVTEDGLTPFAQKELDNPEKAATATSVEIFKRKELSFCVVDHTLVPPHVPLSAGEKRALLQKLGCKAAALPRIKDSDPVCRFMRFSPGSVLKITRNIGTSSEEYYRLVVS